LLKETHMNHMGKLAFRWIYWNMLIKGKHIPFVSSICFPAVSIVADTKGICFPFINMFQYIHLKANFPMWFMCDYFIRLNGTTPAKWNVHFTGSCV
ncbi:MAG: hypothetical protein P8X62_11535, partial [Flavobacteriaceae bacterium]